MIQLINSEFGLQIIMAFSIGLLGSLHCIGMCGGISSALATAMTPSAATSTLSEFIRKISFQIFYSAGRIGSYMIAGVLVGSLGATVSYLTQSQGLSILRILSGVMMILLGFYISGWWMGLAKLERAGSVLWKQIRPLTTPLIPVDSLWKAGALGALWGWLPCGLVYSALTYSMASGSPLHSAILMLSFGVGTLPAMIGVGFLGGILSEVARSKKTRSLAGILMIIYGGWTLSSLFLMSHQHHGTPSEDHTIDHSQMHH